MSTHISAKEGEIAQTVLMPGDPLRAKYIAETFLSDVNMYNNVRGMHGYTGYYQGKRVSVQGSGMGMPSFSIYANELIRFYNVKNIIRVGSCGAMQEHLKIRDIILAQAACSTSNLNNRRFNGMNYSPIADFDLLQSAYNKALEMGCKVHVGNIISEDSFYDDYDNFRNSVFKDYGVLAVEMEAAELYTLAAKWGIKALCILTVSDHLITAEETSADERERTFDQMIQIILESCLD